MKTLKKLTALVLVIVMCAGCLAACGAAPDPDSQGPQAQLPTEQEQTAPPPQSDPPTEPAAETKTVWVLSKEILYRVEGYPESFYEYTYDEKGFRTGGAKYSANGELIQDLDYYTYTIEDNVVTRYVVNFMDGTTADSVYHFTIDEDGILRRICADLTSRNMRVRDFVPHYNEDGILTGFDQHINSNGEYQETPYYTREFDLDESTRVLHYGSEQFALDENGRIIKYIVIDPQTGKCKRSYYTCYEYKAIEVPVEYAALAQGMAGYLDLMYY